MDLVPEESRSLTGTANFTQLTVQPPGRAVSFRLPSAHMASMSTNPSARTPQAASGASTLSKKIADKGYLVAGMLVAAGLTLIASGIATLLGGE